MKKVLVGMSGGVDSSVTAMLLKDKGFHVEGVTMYLGSHSEGALKRAKEVAKKLNIKHRTLNISEVFKKNIISFFVDGYNKGETPLPCAKCNKEIKFGAVLDYLQSLDFDYFATGHYVKMIRNNKNILEILRPKDLSKDQTHFLYGVDVDALKYILFPLSDFKKTEIKEISKRLDLGLDKQSESQDICFLENKPYVNFLEKNIKNSNLFKKGKIIHIETCKELGVHNGLIRYTVGQRRNLGIAYREPLYVIKMDLHANIVYAGEEKYLYKKEFKLNSVNILALEFINNAKIDNIKIATRAMKEPKIGSILIDKKNKKASVLLQEGDRAITVGQVAVFYIENRMIGGGIIESISS